MKTVERFRARLAVYEKFMHGAPGYGELESMRQAMYALPGFVDWNHLPGS